MSETQKDTIYIDIDDEITGVIDKIRASKHKIVALVLPKRATVFQSIVNMKLIKRTAGDLNKRVVLITSEAQVLPLAGAVGLHAAKTLQSKPEIPPAPETAKEDLALEEPDGSSEPEEGEEPELDNTKSIGELAGVGAGVAVAPKEETIELDNEPQAPAAGSKGKKKKDKKLVPNFNKFRTRLLIIGGAVLGLIIIWVFASIFLPKAKITIKTETSTVNSSIDATLDANAKEVDEDKGVVPAKQKEVKKTDTEKVAATGQKDKGEKATGTVSLKNCTKTDGEVSIPAGTAVSTGGLNFITQAAASLPASTFSGGGSCTTATADVNVAAQNGGTQYNISAGKTFSVAGFGSVSGVDSSAMTGGTSNIVKVISQTDVDTAKQRLNDKSKSAAIDELKKNFSKDNLKGINETLGGTVQQITVSPNVGDEASEVTVTQVVTYTMLGVREDDLKKLIENDVKNDIDTKKQAVTDAGLDQAVIKLESKKSETEQMISIQTIVTAGTKIDQDALKKQIAGKKKGDVQQIILSYPGVKDVDVSYSPFWVYKTPKRTSRITINFEKAEGNAGN